MNTTTTTLNNDTISIAPIVLLFLITVLVIYFTVYNTNQTPQQYNTKKCPIHNTPLNTNTFYIQQNVPQYYDHTDVDNMIPKNNARVHTYTNTNTNTASKNTNSILIGDSISNVQNGTLLSSKAQHELDSITKIVKYKQLCTI